MRYMKAAVGAAAMVLWVSTAAAQQPNFAGKWTPDAEQNAAANPGGGGGGGRGGGRGGGMMGPMTITQDAGTLTIARETPNGAVTTTYKLDGSEQEIQQGQGTAKATAKWDGSKLVITTTRTMDQGSFTTTAEYTLEGGDLVISTTSPGRGGGDPVTRKMYYKKG